MDVPRTGLWRSLAAVSVIAALAAATMGFSALKAAPPTVKEDLVWIGQVQRGEFVRQVRGNGTLVPKDEWWIPAPADGRVDRIHIQPGETVLPGTVILTLSNPALEREVLNAQWELKAAEAELENQKAQLETQRLDREEALVTLESELTVAKLALERDQKLYDDGIVSRHILNISEAKFEELTTRMKLAKRRLVKTAEATDARLSVQQATAEQLSGQLQLKEKLLHDLDITSKEAGILQQVLVEAGQQVTPATSLVKVARPDSLKAEIKIAETQMKDVVVGQSVSIDTRNGIIAAHVGRIDPAVLEGSVMVEVELDGELPKGARPDLSVEGVIEIERLNDVLYTGRPVSSREFGQVEIFKVARDTGIAEKTLVRLGRSSVNQVEIVEGLQEGDRVILSDMAKWADVDRIRLK
jgi:HlyD family secretion protein